VSKTTRLPSPESSPPAAPPAIWAPTSVFVLVSPATMLEAPDENVTYRPSAEIPA
jgi:hypothetical protein